MTTEELIELLKQHPGKKVYLWSCEDLEYYSPTTGLSLIDDEHIKCHFYVSELRWPVRWQKVLERHQQFDTYQQVIIT